MNMQPATTRSINPFLGLLVLGLIVAAIWIWNHLNFDTQDFIVDEIIPILLMMMGVGVGLGIMWKKWRTRKERLQGSAPAAFQKGAFSSKTTGSRLYHY